MRVRYYLDPQTGNPRIWDHRVREAEVEQVLRRPREDRAGVDGSRVAIGRAGSGRHLRVIYVADTECDSVFVITAYELTGKPLTAYRRRQRRRGQE